MRHYVCAPKAYQLPVLFQSMVRHCQPFVLHVLAWDFEMADFAGTRKTLARLDPRTDGKLTTRAQFLARHPDLATLPGPPRNTNETVCSIRWRFAIDVMEETGQPVTLIDGDQFLFSSPEPVFAEIGDAPFALSPHNFASRADGYPGVSAETHGKFGRFNGGWSYWRRPDALRMMATQAEQWCYQGFDGNGRYGDQGRMEVVLGDYPDGHVIQHPGVNLGPWSVHHHRGLGLELYGDAAGPILLWQKRPLVSYHMQSLRIDETTGKVIQLADASYQITAEQERLIYAPYLRALGADFPS